MTENPYLQVAGLWLKYQNEFILQDFALSVQKGEILVVLGESGCGKTSLLKIILGILPPDRGEVFLGGEDITYLPPQKRLMGYVPQAQVLFPHMTARENIMFGLKVHRELADPEALYRRAVEITQLQPLEGRYPSELSGGQQQRVALARAIAIQPHMLLLDEPLSSIDATAREELALTIRRVQQETNTTIIYVTHSHAEAQIIADRIAVIFNGVVQQLGAARQMYQSPRNYRVAKILGKDNIWAARALPDGKAPSGRVQVECSLGIIEATPPPSGEVTGVHVPVAVYTANFSPLPPTAPPLMVVDAPSANAQVNERSSETIEEGLNRGTKNQNEKGQGRATSAGGPPAPGETEVYALWGKVHVTTPYDEATDLVIIGLPPDSTKYLKVYVTHAMGQKLHVGGYLIVQIPRTAFQAF